MLTLEQAVYAQESVIGSMLREEKCVPVVFRKLRPEDFTEPTCRTVCTAIHKLFLENGPLDPVPIVGAIKGGDSYVPWIKRVMEETPTTANVEAYIEQVQEASRMHRFRDLCGKGMACTDTVEAAELYRQMAVVLTATDRIPRMTAKERFADFYRRMQDPEKPKYLPWGIPVADRATYAQLGDMILLGGYASSGKTLLSILMAQTQARAGYRVGYYSLETSPEKMTDRQAASLSRIPLNRIKDHKLGPNDWPRLAEACSIGAGECPFTIIPASGLTVDDITTDALGYGYQIIYVDYVQQLRVAGMRSDNPRIVVTEVSQRLKRFAQSTGTAVVALAQLTRPPRENGEILAPTMHSFKESGQLEQDADVAFLVWASDPNNNASNRAFKIGKNKEGGRYTVTLAFHGDTQTMVELDDRGRAVRQETPINGQVDFQEVIGAEEDNPFD